MSAGGYTKTPEAPAVAFVTADARRALKWRAALLAIFLGGLQLLAPVVLVFWMMADMMMGMRSHGEVQTLAATDSHLWWTEHPLGDRTKHDLKRQAVADEHSHLVTPLARPDYLLAPLGDAVWIISENDVRLVRDTEEQTARPTRPLVLFSSPHTVDGQPAVVDWKYQDAVVVQVVQQGEWRELGQIGFDPAPAKSPEDFLAAPAPAGRYHLFCRYGNTFRHIQARLGDTVDSPERWPEVMDAWVQHWDATVVLGRPVLVTLESSFGYPQVVARRLGGAAWEEVLRKTLPVASRVGADTGREGDLLVSVGGPFGVRELWRITAGGAVEHHVIGEQPLWADPVGIMQVSLPFYLLPLLALPAAMLLGLWLRRLRAVDQPVDYTGRRYASLTRRALARGVDLLLVSAPFGVLGLLLLVGVIDAAEALLSPVVLAAIGAGTLLWYPPVLALLAWLEGRWGKTPGKWLCRIRTLGTDLKPCGFWRAVLRNLLLIADQFGNYAVGLLAIAFTQRLQRVGDLVANTVVVDDAPPA